MTTRPPIALTIAGTDPSGGAGIHADLKTFTARKTLGTSVITALVAQNTHGVSRVYPIDDDFVADQFDSVLNDMPVDATKSGMLGSRSLVELVVSRAAAGSLGFFTVDPVMIATSGHRLLAADAVDAVRTHLLPVADLITPNLPEAALLLSDDEPEAQAPDQMRDQALRLLERGPGAVLLKGGHGTDGDVTDILATRDGQIREFTHPRVATANTHGTGCTLSAAITAEAAVLGHGSGRAGIGFDLLGEAVGNALEYLARALRSAADWQVSIDPEGAHGPVDHQVDIVRGSPA
ncbi:bifunctional hydroxymethylpyrimidine kinase/phosphomethylpyrimidine kinase [Brevibacterium spongiae]|uniref:Bifunctional hydroxymethylpyrimidine kinase/phosphomethylpyrimidine kinase n=1 Tax=Brevibacterium spongiae TaxID=2909672 RepID=A0ABY5SLZ4_9MICO|nr:bifunctional hydroxymethylpyrimidine kinase/phosphomethylpyrimidine kinase [Brevibacterium spongiae]UVI35180.1 bifunctional hydroxymethylpyrimidine kinase/phosphomethylpyrimidine kinase [Brevibacterium spongiae]